MNAESREQSIPPTSAFAHVAAGVPARNGGIFAGVGVAAAISAVIHVVVFVGTGIVIARAAQSKFAPVKMRIAEAEEPPPQPAAPVEAPQPVAPVRPKTAPKPMAKPTPVQGLAADSLSTSGQGIAAPVGNSLSVADEGKRLRPDQVAELSDQTADAKLIRTSVPTPKYTDDAIDANLEGLFTVEVFVDTEGRVTKAELPKKIGYGMDARVIAAAMQARFVPAKDKLGLVIAGWTEIKFRLELPTQ